MHYPIILSHLLSGTCYYLDDLVYVCFFVVVIVF